MPGNVKLSEAAFDVLVERAGDDPRKLAALSALALTTGPAERAYALASRARALAPDDPDIRSLTHDPFTARVPGWHFGIVRDTARNQAYQAAIERAVGPQTRVLDIGAGTGLLAMMAARAGAREVISCEMNPAVADAAAEIVALNGYGDRIRIIVRHSRDLDPARDMGGRVDLLVSEIVSNDLLREAALPVMEDVVGRLLKPGGRIIPQSGAIRVALASWAGLDGRRLGDVAGFDMTPFNRLHRWPRKIEAGDAALALRGPSEELFDFDFASGGPYQGRRTDIELSAEGGRVNGIAQWIRLQLDPDLAYENRPGPGAASCWAVLFYPLKNEIDLEPGARLRVWGAHTREGVRIWTEE